MKFSDEQIDLAAWALVKELDHREGHRGRTFTEMLADDRETVVRHAQIFTQRTAVHSGVFHVSLAQAIEEANVEDVLSRAQQVIAERSENPGGIRP